MELESTGVKPCERMSATEECRLLGGVRAAHQPGMPGQPSQSLSSLRRNRNCAWGYSYIVVSAGKTPHQRGSGFPRSCLVAVRLSTTSWRQILLEDTYRRSLWSADCLGTRGRMWAAPINRERLLSTRPQTAAPLCGTGDSPRWASWFRTLSVLRSSGAEV